MIPGHGFTQRPAPLPHDQAAQRAAEERLELAWAYLDQNSEGEEGDLSELAAPFCGCIPCHVREVLDAAYPHLRALWEDDPS